MLADKKMVSFPKPEVKVIEFANQKIEVEPFLSDSTQRVLIEIYLQELFNEETPIQHRFIRAEDALKLALLENVTNIKLVDESNGEMVGLFGMDEIFRNFSLMTKIADAIENWRDFQYRLQSSVELVKEQKRLNASLGSAVSNIYAKLNTLLDNFSNIDPESLKSMLAEINSSPILKDAVSIFKNNKDGTS